MNDLLIFDTAVRERIMRAIQGRAVAWHLQAATAQTASETLKSEAAARALDQLVLDMDAAATHRGLSVWQELN